MIGATAGAGVLPPTTQDDDSARQPRRFTSEEYWRIAELGIFDRHRVELIDGEILVMAPQSNRHGAAITLIFLALSRIFGRGFWVRPQLTLDLSTYNLPEPDVAVVPGDPSRPDPQLPTSALLIVEESDSTLSFDRGEKGSLYASSGIGEYWIVNLRSLCLEVYRSPRPTTGARFGWEYGEHQVLSPRESLSPLALPSVTIAVADFLAV